MSDRKVTIAVTPEEWKLIAVLRDIPESPLKELLEQVIRDLLSYAREPRCPEMQADGVPCSSASSDCEQCRQLDAILGSLHEAISASGGQPR